MHGYGTYKAKKKKKVSSKRTMFRGVYCTFASCRELKIKPSLYRPGDVLNAPGV